MTTNVSKRQVPLLRILYTWFGVSLANCPERLLSTNDPILMTFGRRMYSGQQQYENPCPPFDSRSTWQKRSVGPEDAHPSYQMQTNVGLD